MTWLRTLTRVGLFVPGCFLAASLGGQEPAEETVSSALELEALLREAKDIQRNQPERSLELAGRVLDSARLLELPSLEAKALNRQGAGYLFLADYPAAFEHFTDSFRLANQIGDQNSVADAVNNLGVVYYLWGSWDRALEHYQQALDVRRSAGDDRGVAAGFNNLGNVAATAERWQEALDYYQRSLELYRQLGDQVQEASSHNNIGLAYLRQDEHEVAKKHFLRAHELATQLDDRSGLAFAETHLGLVLQAEGRLEEAKEAHQRSLELRQDLGDRQGVAICLHNLGALWAERGDASSAIRELEAALELALDLDILQLIRDTYLKLSEVREQAGDRKGALADYKHYHDLEGRLFSEASQNKLTELRAGFEIDKKDRQIEQLEVRRARQRLLRWILGLVSLLLSAILVLLFSRFRLKVRVNHEISARNSALELAQTELERATRTEVAHLSRVASLGELTAAVAHELNQPLSVILANAQVAETLLADRHVEDPEIEGAVHDIVLGSRRTWELLHHLRKLARSGEIEPELLDLRDVVREIEPLLSTESRLNLVRFEVELPSYDLPVAADAVHLQQVVLNLVQNGIRAATASSGQDAPHESRSWVHLVAWRDDDRIELSVEDSGPCVNDEVFERMFEAFFTTTEDGMGMGLAICRRLVQAHGGQIWAKRPAGKGLAVGFRLPSAPPASAVSPAP